jgi:hypothetical protein
MLWLCYAPLERRWYLYSIGINTLQPKLLCRCSSFAALNALASRLAEHDRCLRKDAGGVFPDVEGLKTLFSGSYRYDSKL